MLAKGAFVTLSRGALPNSMPDAQTFEIAAEFGI